MTSSAIASLLSQKVYQDLTRGGGIPGEGTRFTVLETSPATSSGFYGAIIRDNQTGENYLAVRGTEPFTAADLKADGNILIHQVPQGQFDAAKTFYDANKNTYSISAITGHSLGGYLSNLLGIYSNKDVIGFGTPGVAESMASFRSMGYGSYIDSYNYAKITNYSGRDDLIGLSGHQLAGSNTVYLNFDSYMQESPLGNILSAFNAATISSPIGGLGTVYDIAWGVMYHNADNYTRCLSGAAALTPTYSTTYNRFDLTFSIVGIGDEGDARNFSIQCGQQLTNSQLNSGKTLLTKLKFKENSASTTPIYGSILGETTKATNALSYFGKSTSDLFTGSKSFGLLA